MFPPTVVHQNAAATMTALLRPYAARAGLAPQ